MSKFHETLAGMKPSTKKEKEKEKDEKDDSSSSEKGINSASVHGEEGTGYKPPSSSPHDCGHCHYFVGPVGAKGPKRGEKGCNQKDMRARSELSKFPDGRVKVEAKGICAYIEPIASSSSSK